MNLNGGNPILFTAEGGLKVVRFVPDSTFRILTSAIWLKLDRYGGAGTTSEQAVNLVAKPNEGPLRKTNLVLKNVFTNAMLAIEVTQEPGDGSDTAGQNPKSYLDMALLGRILPYISKGRFSENAPYVRLYPDLMRSGNDTPVPVPVTTSSNVVLMSALEQTSNDAIVHPDTGFLLPRSFKAAMFSVGKLDAGGLAEAPSSYTTFTALGETLDRPRIKVVACNRATVSGISGGGYLAYSVATCVLLHDRNDLLPTWKGQILSDTAVPLPETDSPGEWARKAVLAALQPLAIKGPGSRVVVLDNSAALPALQCGTVCIGVRQPLVQNRQALSVETPWTPDPGTTVDIPALPFTFAYSAMRRKAAIVDVVVPVSVLCGVYRPVAAGKSVPAYSAVYATAHNVAAVLAREFNRTHGRAVSAVSVEASAEPRQVQGRPDLFYATVKVSIAVQVTVGRGVSK